MHVVFQLEHASLSTIRSTPLLAHAIQHVSIPAVQYTTGTHLLARILEKSPAPRLYSGTTIPAKTGNKELTTSELSPDGKSSLRVRARAGLWGRLAPSLMS